MKTWRLACVMAAAGVAAGPVLSAGPGLAVAGEDFAWPRWQARLQLFSESAPSTSLLGSGAALGMAPTRSAAVFGDVFLSRPWFGETGGARVTSGLLVGPRGAVLSPGVTSGSAPNGVVGYLGQTPGAAPGLADPAADSTLTWPYLGVGYSGSSLRYGLNFSADLGLAAQNPGAIRLGRVGSAGLDEFARELKLMPVLQLGVSYRF
jgi:hypothetical protein